MPISPLNPPMKIAVIGSGIAGMGAAWLLAKDGHNVTLYEKNARIGGHTRTMKVDYPTEKGSQNLPVDTGFIVFNHRNYPHLTSLFKALDVPTDKSDMSFGVSIGNGALEYAGSLRGLLAQGANWRKPAFLLMLWDVLKFNRRAKHILKDTRNITLGQWLDELKMGEWFRNYYLLPMGGSIWSCPTAQMLEFPAQSFVRFFENHGLTTLFNQPQWHTVRGGSQEYINRLLPAISDVRLNAKVIKIQRFVEKVEVTDATGNVENYDHAIIAAHGDEALAMLADADVAERAALGSFRYQNNTAVLHRDENLMPKRRAAWASWIYASNATPESKILQQEEAKQGVSLTYWMNNLQPHLPADKPLFVTLNPTKMPDEKLVFDTHQFTHPVFDKAAVAAQAKLPAIQGQRRTWFCGAYHRYGFHEDGLMSAVDVARQLGADIPWE